jgi:predicted negative regulator of RcsB-dependent stress response
MSTYDLEEQEQIDELKTWWKMHGNLVTAVVVAAAVAVLGWQGWTWWHATRRHRLRSSMAAHMAMVQQMPSERADRRADRVCGQFTGLAAAVGEGAGGRRRCQAARKLAWATDNAKDEGVRDLARLRLWRCCSTTRPTTRH